VSVGHARPFARGRILEAGLAAITRQVVARLQKEVPPDRVKTLLTDALLLTGLHVRRDMAARIF
jgi:hypothetical protein